MAKKQLFSTLKAELKRNGLSDKEYGEKIGLSPSGVSMRLNGNVQFSLSEMILTKQLLKKDLDTLFDSDSDVMRSNTAV